MTDFIVIMLLMYISVGEDGPLSDGYRSRRTSERQISVGSDLDFPMELDDAIEEKEESATQILTAQVSVCMKINPEK